MNKQTSMRTRAAAFQDARRIWRATTLQRDPRALRFMTGFALLLTAAIPIVAGVSLVREHTLPVLLLLRILLGIGGLWLMIVWIWLFVPAAVLMNSAANARLLPRQRRRLLQMALGGWLLVTLALTAASGNWRIFPLAGIYVLGFALMRAGNLHAVVLTVLPGFWPLLSRHMLPEALARFVSAGPGLPGASVVLAGAAAWALARLYPAGGDRHLDSRGAQVKRMHRFESSGWAATAGDGDSVMALPGLRTYLALLRRDCRAPRPERMLGHAFGPSGHWSAWIPTIAILLALNLGVYLLVATRGEAAMRGFLEGFSWSALSGLAFMTAFSTAHVRQQLDRTRGEQALLCLTPLAGDKAALNRRLAKGMLKTASMLWMVLTAMALLISSVFGGAELLLRQFALCCLGGQCALACLYGDFSRTPRLGLVNGVLLALLAAAELALAGGLGWLCGNPLLWTWPWLIALSAGIGAFQLRRGWNTLLAAPVAFPAGRLA